MSIIACNCFGNRIAVYKAVYPTVGTLTDVVAAMDQVSFDNVFQLPWLKWEYDGSKR